jgi:arsenite-transporting ATPase
MNILENATRYLFFTGKGGVGKTSLSCATAVALADKGKKVLLVSTDPASNLDEVLQVKLQQIPTAVLEVENLFALNIDPEKAAAAYRDRLVGPYRGVLPDATVASMEEQLSGSCTTEIAAFDEFARFLGDAAQTADFDHVIFDTAPTGHTMRLLTLPESWSTFISENTSGMSCLGPLSGLSQHQSLYLDTVEALKDPVRTTLVLVTRPEKTAFREVANTSLELRAIGMTNQCLLINGLFKASYVGDEIAAAVEERGSIALASIPSELYALPQQKVFIRPAPLLGAEALREVFVSSEFNSQSFVHNGPVCVLSPEHLQESLASLVSEFEKSGSGVIMTMGKGGVGKTTIAAAIALALAKRGHNVHLSTTDPAAHVNWIVGDSVPNLTVSRIDPALETQNYQAEVLETAGLHLDASARALLEEDLRSPCTEEVAVFRSFADVVSKGENGFVVLDTAPTGHTILLLDAAQAYHREVLRQTSNLPDSVLNLLPRLRDPEFTHVLVITLPEATPVHEAERLQNDLRRAGIEPFAWVINQSFLAVATTDSVLLRRQCLEKKYIDEVFAAHAERAVLVPWLKVAPADLAGLQAMLNEEEPAKMYG